MIKPTPSFSLSLSPGKTGALCPGREASIGLGLPFIQGPPGTDGRDGQDGKNGVDGTNGRDGASPGSFPGFGQITYTHIPPNPGDRLDPSAPVQLIFTADTPVQDELNGVFTGFPFWNGSILMGRSMYDLVEVQLNLQVSSLVSGGFIQAYLDAGSANGPIVSSTATLFSPANTIERVTFLMNFQVLGNVLANGIKVFLRSTVPALIVRETLLVMPRSTHG